MGKHEQYFEEQGSLECRLEAFITLCTEVHRDPIEEISDLVRIAFGHNMTEGPVKVEISEDHGEIKEKYDTLGKIVKQLEICEYECEAGALVKNVAFLSLKRMSNKE